MLMTIVIDEVVNCYSFLTEKDMGYNGAHDRGQ